MTRFEDQENKHFRRNSDSIRSRFLRTADIYMISLKIISENINTEFLNSSNISGMSKKKVFLKTKVSLFLCATRYVPNFSLWLRLGQQTRRSCLFGGDNLEIMFKLSILHYRLQGSLRIFKIDNNFNSNRKSLSHQMTIYFIRVGT